MCSVEERYENWLSLVTSNQIIANNNIINAINNNNNLINNINLIKNCDILWNNYNENNIIQEILSNEFDFLN